ncbi:MAG: FKBP-type peptidyl-prolyl cis-trans isomerase [Lentisphaeraceae bacterium]|nr:FKBP-type peptidyl-prolyl cis-trans isomerase [Lentisphaeraceae bacterium]
MEAVETETVVSIEYVIADPQGNILDSSEKEIMSFVFGVGRLPANVESQLVGKKADEMIKFTLPAKEAYGERDESLVFEIGPDSFEEGLKIYEGMVFQRQTEAGLQVARVQNIEGDKITADANHPFAGIDVSWHIVVVDVRPATYQEILNGEPNNSGHPCGEETAYACDKKDECQEYCGK